MNHDQQKKFAELIQLECNKKVPPAQVIKPASFKQELAVMLAGVFSLLAICVVLFEGVMIPAVWQLTSVFWLMWRVTKIKA